MAPKRSQKPDDTDDNDNNNDNPTWDSNDRNLMLYLLKLKRWIPKQHKQWNNFARFGYIVNSRQEVVCFSDTHKESLKSGFRAGTFSRNLVWQVWTKKMMKKMMQVRWTAAR